MATDVSLTPWHPVEHPECTNCNGLSRPVRKRRKAPIFDCGMVTLQLSRKAQLRRHFHSLVFRSELPQETLARHIFGIDPATLWRYLNGGVIPHSTESQIRSIQYIKREGADVVVVYNTGAPSKHWDAMLRRRKRKVKIAPCAINTV